MDEAGLRGVAPVADDVVRAAVLVLGWPGVVLPAVTVFGCRLLPVVVLDPEVHRQRRRTGDGPQLDADVLAVWEWPETLGPAPAVRLSGGLFRMRPRRSAALEQAREWRPFGPAAVLAPAVVVADEVTRWECALHGVGLVADPTSGQDASIDHVPAEAGRRAPARRRIADRWIEETLYALALNAGAFGP